MDIMGIETSDDANRFIKHSSKHECWIVGEEQIDLQKFCVDPETIQIGWGAWEGMYEFVWDEKPGVRSDKPGPDWKRAFSVWLYNKNIGPKLWQNFTWGESKGFNQMLSLIWNDIEHNKGKVAVFEYTGSNKETFKIGSSSIPKFTFIQWMDKPTEFTIPTQSTSAEAPKSLDDFDNEPDDDLPF